MGRTTLSLGEVCRGISRLGIDSSPIIYFVENRLPYADICAEAFREIEAGEIVGVASTLTLTEVLAHPLRNERADLADAYRMLLQATEGIQLVVIDARIADFAGELRARYNLKTPDALQIATAVLSGCEAFLTNDKGLKRVSEIRILALDDFILQQ